MPKINYSNITLYKLYCKDESVRDIFVRSTSNLNVKRAIHKRNSITKPDDKISLVINANGGWEKWDTCILEHFSCNNSKELAEREKYWYNLLITQNLHKIPQFSTEITQFSTKITQFSTEKSTKLECEGCCKVLSRNDSLKRHTLICKKYKKQREQEEREEKEREEKEREEKEKERERENDEKIKKLENEIALIMERQNHQVTNRTNSRTKVNSFINGSHNGSNNTTTNNLGTINNNITYKLELGNENILEKLSDKQKCEILNKLHGILLYYIKKIHFSGEFPECMNVVLTNLRSKYAHKYSETEEKFITQIATDIFTELIDVRFDEICDIFDEKRETLNTTTETRMNAFIDGMKNNPKKYKKTMDDVMLMAYNNRDKAELGDAMTPSV